jgi:pimeloyl-ACP methyl ester carboxylesterase
MPKATTNGITLEYETLGPQAGAPLLIIQGLGDQLVKWSDGFHQELACRGFRVIRFDNRDVGFSAHLDEVGIPDIATVTAAIAQGRDPHVPYQLTDLAADAVSVLDAAGARRAHIVGASMGGMVAQLVASAPDPSDADALLEHLVVCARVLGSPGYPEDDAALRAALSSAASRDYAPAGFARQLAATAAATDRRAKLGSVRVASLVIHGLADPLLVFECGRDTAESIPGAELLAFSGMGHNLPRALYRRIADAIAGLAARA